MSKGFSIFFATMTFFGFIFLVDFIIFNMMLNCQTWDEQMWNSTNSCVTPMQMLGLK